MKTKIWNAVRVGIKILLCVSLIISVNLLLNYVRNLNPTADGFDLSNTVARWIHGDGYWTWEKLTAGLTVSFGAFIVIFCADKAIEYFYRKEKHRNEYCGKCQIEA